MGSDIQKVMNTAQIRLILFMTLCLDIVTEIQELMKTSLIKLIILMTLCPHIVRIATDIQVLMKRA